MSEPGSPPDATAAVPSAVEPAPVPEEFVLLYDEDELARIEQQRVIVAARGIIDAVEARGSDLSFEASDALEDGDDGPSRGLTGGGLVRRYGMLGAMGARSMLGVAEVIEPEKAKRTVIEFAPDRVPEDEQLVTFHFVPGDPQASRLVIRPWLLGRRRWSREPHVSS